MSTISSGWRSSGSGRDLPVTKTDIAYQSIKQMILEGEMPPGAPLDQETLAAKLGLSTTPVREALRRLESERLVVTRAHRDTVVAPLSMSTVEDVYAVRLSLDPLAVALAAARASAEQKERMLTLSHELPTSGSPVDHVYLNRQLHRAVYESCGNTVLINFLDTLWNLSDRYRLVTLTDNSNLISVARAEHLAIVSAVVHENPELAADLMREHLTASLHSIRAAGLLAE